MQRTCARSIQWIDADLRDGHSAFDMAMRPPKSLARVIKPETGLSMMEVEMQAEAAASLGHHGRKVEKALAALGAASAKSRPRLIHAASREVWAYLIQRELMGMRDHRLIIREMAIPREVLNLMGAVSKD